jgi:hypothetical protein
MIRVFKICFAGSPTASGNPSDSSASGSQTISAVCLGLLALSLSLHSGCMSSGPSPVDSSRARTALTTALDHWKSGGDAKSLESSGTPMVAQDHEWTGGAKLLDYEILDEKTDGPNLRVKVKIKLSPQGSSKPVEKKASYVVGTSPSLTVFRDIMAR